MSILYFYLNVFETKTETLSIFADNCSGQNKNNYFIWFLHWLCHTKKFAKQIQYNFLVRGHTKFKPDANFGIAKSNFLTKEEVVTPNDLEEAIADYDKIVDPEKKLWEKDGSLYQNFHEGLNLV
jgi:hypothetical protein